MAVIANLIEPHRVTRARAGWRCQQTSSNAYVLRPPACEASLATVAQTG